MTSGDVYCWGFNSKGQLGAAVTRDACIPFQAPGTRGGDTTTKLQCSYTAVKVSGISGATTTGRHVAHPSDQPGQLAVPTDQEISTARRPPHKNNNRRKTAA